MNTQEIAIELGGGNAEQPISGIQFNYISKSGSNNVNGDVIGSLTNHNFQSSIGGRKRPFRLEHVGRNEDLIIGRFARREAREIRVVALQMRIDVIQG